MQSLLIINAGSSSLKFAVYGLPLAEGASPAFRGQIDGIGASAQFVVKGADGEKCLDKTLPSQGGDQEAEHQTALDALMAWLNAQSLTLAAVGHRVVHGGEKYSAPILLTPSVVDELADLARLALFPDDLSAN